MIFAKTRRKKYNFRRVTEQSPNIYKTKLNKLRGNQGLNNKDAGFKSNRPLILMNKTPLRLENDEPERFEKSGRGLNQLPLNINYLGKFSH